MGWESTEMSDFLSIDPGTIVMGWAVFEGERHAERPKYIGAYTVRAELTADIRTTAMINFIQETLEVNPGIELVACEKWLGPRNPQLQTLITALGQTVRKHWKLGWATYHNSSVFASVKPRGYRGRHSDQRKKAITDGVLGLYPELRLALAKYHPDHTQDALDAVAVGHCHIGVMKVKQLEGTG